MDNLILVESPTKARTLSKFLGSDYQIEATMGHVRDLPEKTLGVDTKNNFQPEYVVSEERKKVVERLIKISGEAKTIFLATDPDREGEAIAWHVAALIEPKSKVNSQRSKLNRIVFHEITEKAVREALKNPRKINMHLVDAQQARRVLDRLVGYNLSPLLWKKIRRGLSAGRVQSVALRLIVERDREIEAFKPLEYWEIEAELTQQSTINKQQITNNNQQTISFRAKLVGKILNENQDNTKTQKNNFESQKIEIHNKEQADKILQDLEGGEWVVLDVNSKEVRKSPYPPYMTSSLQQAAGNKYGWSAKKTMQTAQSLYEAGFITYHRTDSLNLNQEAVYQARKLINSLFGKEYLPEKPNFYKTKSRVAQEAHEAIRPTKIENLEKVKTLIMTELGREQAKLYDLIWKRFLASQMESAIYQQTSADIKVKDFLFRASGQKIKFEGWKRIYGTEKLNLENLENNEMSQNSENILPKLSIGERLNLINLLPSEHFTEPPSKYTEASLVKALEERNIGRPSTYAPIISTILERRYVEKIEKKFSATALGFAVCDFLLNYFSQIMDYEFTAKMEEELDAIANGEIKWVPVIREFYTPFINLLNKVAVSAERVKVEAEETEEKCELCGAKLLIRIGRFGKFLACSRFPDCKFTKPLVFSTGIKCPKCEGEVILKRTKKGKQFYGCSNYPKCDFASWTKPTEKQSQIFNVKSQNQR